MRAWLLILIILSALAVWPKTVQGANTFSISQSFPTNAATGVPVDLGGDNYHSSNFGYATHAINLALSGLPGGCSLNRASFNQQSVQITSPTDSYTLGTITANLTSSTPWIALGSAVAGFELSPNTGYQLLLRGGPNGISLICNGQNLYLTNDFTSLHFQTGNDTVAPLILGPQVRATNSTATISWETFQSTSGQVAFGINSTGQVMNQSGVSTLHSVTLQNLKPGTTYTYQIRSADPVGNIGISSNTFTTLGLSDVTVSDIQDMSATVHWTSNQPTDSIIEFGTSLSYGEEQGNGGQISNHTIKLVGLKPGTIYHFRIVATNTSGASTFGDSQFATKPLPPGAQQASVEGISTSDDNFKMFPQVNFQPMVLGASKAATAISNGFTVGKNLLAGRGVPTGKGSTAWLVALIWLVPLLLIGAIGYLMWWLRHQSDHSKTVVSSR